MNRNRKKRSGIFMLAIVGAGSLFWLSIGIATADDVTQGRSIAVKGITGHRHSVWPVTALMAWYWAPN